MTASWEGVSFGAAVLELDSGDGCTAFGSLKAT